MLISELSARSGVPLATVKFYIREGMLPRGRAVSATRAEYDDDHLARLRVIAALADVRGLPLARVREILALIDAPLPDLLETMGQAVSALPPYVAPGGEDLAPAHDALAVLGWPWIDDFAAVGQLAAAIRAVREAGMPWDEATLRRYADAAASVALSELAPVPGMSASDAVAYAALGTALYEPVLLALRRLAHYRTLVSAAPGGPAAPAPAGEREGSGEA